MNDLFFKKMSKLKKTNKQGLKGQSSLGTQGSISK